MVVLIFMTMITVLSLLFLNSISCMFSCVSLKNVPQAKHPRDRRFEQVSVGGEGRSVTAHNVKD